MKRAAIYRRVSTAGQVDGFSLTVQLEKLSDLAEQQGYEWEDFCDPGRSGEQLETRPALMRLLGRLEDFDAVFVVDESRLARSESVAFAIRDYLRQASVRLVTLSGETDLGDPEESTMSAVKTLFAVAEQYRRTQRMRDGLDRAAAEGLWTGGPAPLGYRLAKAPSGHTTLEIDNEGADFLRLTIGLVVDDGLSVYQTAKRLNALGNRTRNGRPWSHRNLAKHLTRRHLVGEIPYQSANGPVMRGFPPLISEERFTELQEALRQKAQPAPQKAHTYPFSGRIVCECGGHLVGTYRKDRDARYYVCNRNTNSALTGEQCPHSPRQRRADQLEALLWEPIRATLADPKRLEAAAAGLAAEQGPDPADLTARIKNHQRRLEDITNDRMRTFREAPQLGLSNDETRRLLRQLGDEQDEISRELSNLKGQLHVLETQPHGTAQAQQLTEIASARLNDTTLEDQAATVELLDIRIKSTADGYEISGSVPLTGHETGGKIATRDLQHP